MFKCILAKALFQVETSHLLYSASRLYMECNAGLQLMIWNYSVGHKLAAVNKITRKVPF